MKIIHFCVSNFYIDGYGYQENMLVREHTKSGHDVLVVASTEIFNDKKELSYIEPSEYYGEDGAKVIRLPYRCFLPSKVMKKLRMHSGVNSILNDFEPDVIMFHGMCGFELLTIANYVRKNPNVTYYADSHEDFNNSARHFLSRNTLYRLYYNPIISMSKKYIDKVFYITDETKYFCKSVYRLSDDQLEFLPLGGNVLSDNEYNSVRQAKRDSMDISSDEVVFLQTGKFDNEKKLLESLAAFSKTDDSNFKYIVAGNIISSLEEDFKKILNLDNRIKFIGWVDTDELSNLLCMADVYVQPGSQSATMQMSLAARCPVILAKVPSHEHIFSDNGFLVNSDEQLENAFIEISNNPNILVKMSKNSFNFAKEKLDYSILAKRLTQ